MSPRIELATHEDFLEILDNLPDFWSSSGPPERTRPYHYAFLVHQFGDTAFVIHENDRVIAYLFGFIATSEPIGYIHLVGVRSSYQRQGLGRALYDHFEQVARARGCEALKSVTAPFNSDSRAFHQRLGFEIEPGDLDPSGVEVFTDYHGRGESVSIFRRPL
jgi:GNAT superfamily N-acetyltransferase